MTAKGISDKKISMRLKLLILLSVLVFLTACTQKEEKQKGSQDKAVSESGSTEARGSEGMENDPQGTETGNTSGEPASVLSLTKSGPSDSGENETDKSEED